MCNQSFDVKQYDGRNRWSKSQDHDRQDAIGFRSVAAVTPAADDGIAMGLLPALVGYHVRQARMAIFADFDAAPGDLGVSPGISAPASGPP